MLLQTTQHEQTDFLGDGGGGNRTRVRRHIDKGYYMLITGFEFCHSSSPVQDSGKAISSLVSRNAP